MFCFCRKQQKGTVESVSSDVCSFTVQDTNFCLQGNQVLNIAQTLVGMGKEFILESFQHIQWATKLLLCQVLLGKVKIMHPNICRLL